MTAPAMPAEGRRAMSTGLPVSAHCELLELENGAQPPVEFLAIRRALDAASTAAEIVDIEAKIEAIETYLRRSGLAKNLAEMWPVREARLEARWKLGRVLAEMERRPGPGRGKKDVSEGNTFSALLERLGLDRKAAMLAQRIGNLPEQELFAAFADARARKIILDFVELIAIAGPWWREARRRKRHAEIEEAAQTKAAAEPEQLGPFALIYADPPWEFETYSFKGKKGYGDDHYPVLSQAQIADFRVQDRPISSIATTAAALYLWTTIPHLLIGLEVMAAWGFDYKAHGVWIKPTPGLGTIFKNQHEVLLYGTKGDMPAPLYHPPSVFSYPRGRHSAKPPEIRQAIERMYPNFGAASRLELFARGENPGWSNYGFEVHDAKATGE
jgi:N6-adenosine-specific RNA methylase IME4